MAYARNCYVFVLVLAVRLSRWHGNMRVMSGAAGLGMAQFLVLLTIANWVQVETNKRLPVGPYWFALVPVLLYGLNWCVARTRDFERLEQEYNSRPQWQRWAMLAAFVVAAISILLLSVRYMGTYQKHFHIGEYGDR